jgi:hypothetical protein
LAFDPQTVAQWLRRLVNLDIRVFEDVRTNPSATIPAVLIAGLSILLSGIGGWLWWMLQDYGGAGDVFVKSALFGTLLALALWGLAWILVTFVIITQVMRERVYLEQLLRVMGLAMTPLALTLFMAIPGISLGVGIASLALTFGLTTIAIQSVTTANQAQALVANAAGFLLWAAVLTLVVSASSQVAPGVFLFNAPADFVHDVNLGEILDLAGE